jgi:hypothetical protein
MCVSVWWAAFFAVVAWSVGIILMAILIAPSRR